MESDLPNAASTPAFLDDLPDTDGSVGEIQELTFLATDIVGSSDLHRRYPIEMLAAIDTHDRIVHGTIQRCNGNPFKHTGDGVIAAFERPVDAVRAAIEAHREIQIAQWGPTGPLQIRWGIHIGTVRARGGDYFGSALSSVSRLEGAANPGQILISQATYDRIGERGSEGLFRTLDLGQHHFRGVDSLTVLQVVADGMQQRFAPLGGKRESVDNNLPADVNSFLGRQQELADLTELLSERRILTLLGPGGIGKTRLSLQLVRSVSSSFPGGAWMVSLSALEEEADLWAAVAATLGIELVPGADHRDQVIEVLRPIRTVILMDNCEHVLDGVSKLVADLCSACASVVIINTSRRVLGLPGEATYQVKPLADATDGEPESSTAVRLFVERARLAQHDFNPSKDELSTILKICRSLENLPLAIEIAVAQLRRFSLARIAKDAANPLDFSPSRRQPVIRHQHTLRNTLQWSYDLLEIPSREILQRLSVFTGSFREEQALAVCVTPDRDELSVLDSIDELIDSSLLNSRIDGERMLSMLSTVQTFGREKLDENGSIQELEALHGAVYVERSKELGDAFSSADEREAAAAIHEELPNLRSAFERALLSDLSLAARLVEPLFLFNYFHRGAETSDWAGRIMKRPGADKLVQAPLLLAAAAGHTLHEHGHPEDAERLVERGLQLEKDRGPSSRGWLSHTASQIAFWSGNPEKFVEYHRIAVQQAREQGDKACEIVDLSMAAYVKAKIRDKKRATELVEALHAVVQDIKQPSLIGYFHFAKGGLCSFDNPDKAIEELELSVEWAQLGGNSLGARRIQQIIADIRTENADPEEAIAIQIKAIGKLPENGVTIYLWSAIKRLLMPLAQLQSDEHFAVLAGALQRSPMQSNRRLKSEIELARERMGSEAFEKATKLGHSFDQQMARDYAMRVVAHTEV